MISEYFEPHFHMTIIVKKIFFSSLQYDFEAYIKQHACICISEALVPECAHELSHSTFVLLFFLIRKKKKKDYETTMVCVFVCVCVYIYACMHILLQVLKQLSDFHKTWYKYDTNTTCPNTTHFNFYNP